MLRKLKVQDFALVAAAEVRFAPGLNLLTGETGSGKSLIVDALGLCLGARGSLDHVRPGAERALLQADFDAPESLGSQGARVSVEREISGRPEVRIDGRVSPVARLRELGRELVSIHGQHDQQQLLDQDSQTALVDQYASLGPARARMGEAHLAWTQARQRLERAKESRHREASQRDYLVWKLNDLVGARLEAGEEEELTQLRQTLLHVERLGEHLAKALKALGDDAATSLSQHLVREATQLDPRLGPALTRLEALGDEARDIQAELRAHLEGLEADPGRLEEVESRLAFLADLKRRHRGTVDELIAERDRLSAEVAAQEDPEASLEEAVGQERSAYQACIEVARALSRGRQQAAAELSPRLEAELARLGLEGSRLEVWLEPLGELQAQGLERAQFQFSANPGEPLQPLGRVASGGELSRVMLAMRTVAGAFQGEATLVFDEVDAGIGGATAARVGERLSELGRTRQVLVVTHLAQIACFATHHLKVEKAPDQAGRQVVRVVELVGLEERAQELARMMSGAATASSLARALELLREAEDQAQP